MPLQIRFLREVDAASEEGVTDVEDRVRAALAAKNLPVDDVTSLVTQSEKIAAAYRVFRHELSEEMDLEPFQIDSTIIGALFVEAGATSEEVVAICTDFVTLIIAGGTCPD